MQLPFKEINLENSYLDIPIIRIKVDIDTLENGLLTKIPSIRLVRSVFIVRNEDSEKVVDLLEEFKAKVYVRRVILTEEDCRMLGLEPE